MKQTAPAPTRAPSYGGEAETVEDLPQIGVRRTARDQVPLGEVNEPWYWVASPHAWQVLDGRIVPSLRKIILHAGGGIGNVDTVRDHQGKAHAEPSLALSRAALKGEVVLDFHDSRTFVEQDDGSLVPYLTRVRTTGGYISRFEVVFGGTDATITDTAAFARWLEALIDRGVLPMPPVHQLHRLKGVITRQITTYRDKGGAKAAYASRVAKLERDLAVVDQALAEHRRRTLAGAAAAEVDDELPVRPEPTSKREITT